MTLNTINTRITWDRKILDGEPHFLGRRIRVKDVVDWVEHQGKTPQEVTELLNLDLADIYAALAFYYANQKELDQRWEQVASFVADVQAQYPSKVIR